MTQGRVNVCPEAVFHQSQVGKQVCLQPSSTLLGARRICLSIMLTVIFLLGLIHHFYSCAYLPSVQLELNIFSMQQCHGISSSLFMDILKISPCKETRETVLKIFCSLLKFLFLVDFLLLLLNICLVESFSQLFVLCLLFRKGLTLKYKQMLNLTEPKMV